MKHFPWFVILRGLIMIATLVAVGLVFREWDLAERVRDTAWVDSWIRNAGVWDELVVVVLFALIQAIGIPRQVVCFLGGYAFGFWQGLGVCLLAVLLACILNFYYARFLGRDLVQHRLAGRLRGIDGFWTKNPFSMTLMIRLLPIGNNMITNLLAGVSNVAPVPFFLGSVVGYIPQSVVFVLVGSGVGLAAEAQVIVGVVLFAVSAVLGIILFRRFRTDRKPAVVDFLAGKEL